MNLNKHIHTKRICMGLNGIQFTYMLWRKLKKKYQPWEWSLFSFRMDFVWSGELVEILVWSIAVCEHSYSRTINLMSATWIIRICTVQTNVQLRRLNVQEHFCVATLFFPIRTESRLNTAANSKTKFTFQFLYLSIVLPFRFSIARLVVLFSSFVQHCVCCSHVCGSAIKLLLSRMCTVKLEIEKIHCKGKNQAWN